MENSKTIFYKTASKFWKTVVNKETIADFEQLQQQIEFYKRLLNIFHAGDYFYYVFNMYDTKFDMVNENLSKQNETTIYISTPKNF